MSEKKPTQRHELFEPETTDVGQIERTHLAESPFGAFGGEAYHEGEIRTAPGPLDDRVEVTTRVQVSSDLENSAETVLKALPLPGPLAPPAARPEEYGLADTVIRAAPTELDGLLDTVGVGDGTTPLGPRYQVRRMLGPSTFGHAFLAEQVSSGRLVRVEMLEKMIPLNLLEEARRVALTVGALRLPGCVEVIDLEPGEHGRRPFLVTEWFEGAPLSRRLQSNPLSVEEAYFLGASLADTLVAVHAAGMVHGRIDAEMIWGLAGPDPSIRTVKLLGFGMVRLSQAAPVEQAHDVQALALTLLNALAPKALLEPELPGRPSVKNLLRVLKRASDPSLPSQRMLEFRDALREAMSAGPLSTSATEPAPKRGSTLQVLLAFLLALVVAFAATRLVLAFRRQQMVQKIESLSIPP